LGIRLDEKAMLEFPDHHAFNDTDLQRVATTARSRNAEVILCTLKDLVKLPRQLPDGPEILAVDIDLEIVEGRAAWERSLVEIAAAACEKSPQSSDSASA
jgi:tetraacyldisaccharide-1-P 4'-kinase